MEVANTQPYYDTATIITLKSFIVQAPLSLSRKGEIYFCKKFYGTGPLVFQRIKFVDTSSGFYLIWHGTLTEGEGSVRLTSLH